MKWCGCLLGGLGLLAAVAPVSAALFNTAFPIEGTAVNSTNVIGAGSGTATSFDKTNGAPTILGGVPTVTIDAGQYSDGITMYLNNSGVLYFIQNANGDPWRSPISVGDAFGVSGTVEVGGERYCVVAGTTSGVRALRLADGVQFPLGSVTNYNFSGARGLDAFLRPGGTATNDILVGILRYQSLTPKLEMYDASGTFLHQVQPATINGTLNDASFDQASSVVWFGTTSGGQGKLFDAGFDFSAYAVSAPTVSLSVSNGVAVVVWLGRTLEGSSSGSNWQALASAPASPTQLFPPPPYLEPLTNSTRFFRARW